MTVYDLDKDQWLDNIDANVADNKCDGQPLDKPIGHLELLHVLVLQASLLQLCFLDNLLKMRGKPQRSIVKDTGQYQLR